MTNGNSGNNSLIQNMVALRKSHHYTLEQVGEWAGVTRQTVAKWENGESVPDIIHADALASLYGVSLDDLVHFDQKKVGLSIPPKGKHLFGTVQIGQRGQVVIPKKARDAMHFGRGETLVVVGDENAGTAGIALIPSEVFMRQAPATSRPRIRQL